MNLHLTIQIPNCHTQMFEPPTPSTTHISPKQLVRCNASEDLLSPFKKELKRYQARIIRLENVNVLLNAFAEEDLPAYIRVAYNQYLIKYLRRKSIELVCRGIIIKQINN